MVRELQPYQQRVVEEAGELNGRITRLENFLAPSAAVTVTDEELDRLSRQLVAMKQYAAVLEERIAAF